VWCDRVIVLCLRLPLRLVLDGGRTCSHLQQKDLSQGQGSDCKFENHEVVFPGQWHSTSAL
jgi:hypothetical protein